MEEWTDLDSLADAIADRIAMRAPLKDAMWSSKDCAEYFRVASRHFSERIAANHKFPQAYRFPTADGRRTNPRWNAAEVIAWAKRYGRR